jgi:hypothetical protein
MKTKYPLPADWSIALEIIRLRFPDAVIAGGALRDTLLGREVKDIDVFASHPYGWSNAHDIISWTDWADRMLGPSYYVIHEGLAQEYSEGLYGVVCAIEIDAAVTRPRPIQLIMLDTPVTLETVVERIDFGLCRVSHDGTTLFQHPDFVHDVNNRFFTLRRSENEAQYDRSCRRFRRLNEKYPGWPMVDPDTDTRD